MMAQNPLTGKWQFFIDKCLPFGASISCAHFQRVSNALKHIAQVKAGGSPLTNYLDDFLFMALSAFLCNRNMQVFLEVCAQIGFPVSEDKTEWASELMIFLGILLDGRNFLLGVPSEKKERAIYLLKTMIDQKKAMVKELQVLCGFLNFISKAIFPGRAFMHQMYSKYSGGEGFTKLKQHHHVRLDREFKKDCAIWLQFSGSRQQ